MGFFTGVAVGAVLGMGFTAWLVREWRHAKARATNYDPFPEKSPDGRIYEEARLRRVEVSAIEQAKPEAVDVPIGDRKAPNPSDFLQIELHLS